MEHTQQFHELSFYTLAHPDKSFIHQHIVDAQTAQVADENTKIIAIVYALAGLYLYIEQNFTGREVQLFHIKMSKNKTDLPAIILPKKRGELTISHVLKKDDGKERDNMIKEWCVSVWEAYGESREIIVDYVNYFL